MDTPKDLENIKKKLLEQISSKYEPDQAKTFTEKINSMNDEAFIEFIKQQGLIPGENGETSQCVFCALANGKMPRTDIGENSKATAILELNPISKGHSLILPKEHITDAATMPQEAKNLAEKIKADLERTFKPTRVDIIPANVMGHEAINVLPIYSSETIDSAKSQETPEGLAAIKKQIADSEVKTIEEPAAPETIEENSKVEEVEKKDWIPKKHRP